MNNKLTKIRFHGKLGEYINREFNVKINSIRDGLRAVDSISKRKFSKFFLEDQSNMEGEYHVLVNGKDIASSSKRIDTIEKVKNSELLMLNPNIETLDIVPVVKGAGDSFMSFLVIIIAVIIIAIGAFTGNVALIMVGVGLLVTGIMGLLAEPPAFPDFKDPGKGKSFGQSYMFEGPQNAAGEGVPVPIGYGRLLIGAHVVATSYETIYKDSRIHALQN